MIYIKLILYILFGIAMFALCTICFLFGILTYPLVCAVYYVIYGEIDSMRYDVDVVSAKLSDWYIKLGKNL